MKFVNPLNILDLAKQDRYTLVKELNKLIKERLGNLHDLINEETMVFNRYHMAVFIELLKEDEQEEVQLS